MEAGRSIGWDWDIKSDRDRWFGDLETVFGIPEHSYSGPGEEFRRKVHPEDRERILKAVADARENRKPFVAEFRVIRTDSIVRWISARGKFYYDRHGDAERMLGMVIDITDRKQVEEDLASLSGRLISAQEEERKRIAREIHDDYSQQLALLAMDLENLEEEIENPSANQKIHQIWDGVGQIGADLHSLSHRLHSSTLDTLGLVAGAKAFCTEFGEQQGIRSILQMRMSRVTFHPIRLCVFFASSRRDSEISNGTAVPTGQKFVWSVQERNCMFQLPIEDEGLM